MKHINEVINKYGPATKLEGDRNYCTVSALSASFGMPFDQAHDYASTLWKRVKGKGVRTLTMLKTFPEKVSEKAKVMGKDMQRVESTLDYKQPNGTIKTRKMTLSTFCKHYPRGKYYILVDSHALAIVDSEIIDHTDKPKRRIKYAWYVR